MDMWCCGLEWDRRGKAKEPAVAVNNMEDTSNIA